MKHKLFLLILLLIIPLNNTYASTDIYIKCPNGVGVGSTIDCELLATSDIELSAISTKLKFSNNLEFVSFKTDPSWQGDGNNGEIDLYTYPNQIGEIKLGIVTVKIKENSTNRTGTLYFDNVYFYKADFSKVSGNSISKNIKILSSNNDLASLSLINYNITPNFNKDITEYRATVDSDIIVIEARSEDEFATINGTGRKELNYGENHYTITVTSELGTTKTYKLIITRPNEKENYFNREELTKQEPPKKEETKKDNDSKLKSLIIDGYNIDFNSNQYRYDIEVSSNIDKLEIKASPNCDTAKITINGNDNLNIGKNEITITVEAEDGTKSTYIIYATKKSNICVIKSILITNYDFKFNCNKYEYELQIGTEDSLNIEVIPTSNQAKIQIINNDNLKNGDIITILVNVDNIDYKYHIKVIKNELNNSNIINNKHFILIASIVILGLLYLIGKYLVKKKK